MVFQSYALYPHMTVAQNLAFPLTIKKLPKREIDEQVAKIARVLGLEQLLSRKPKALSGGQRQRVALGRALVRKPRAFLMDEPLSNLDARLRLEMREELKRLHTLFPVTTIYVTHDQEEALALSDRIAVFDRGRIQQCAAPQAIYDKPANLFVAEFIGSPPINVLDASPLRALFEARSAKVATDGLRIGIRPADIAVTRDPGEATIEAQVQVVEPTGNDVWVISEWQGKKIRGRLAPGERVSPGEAAHFDFDLDRVHYFAATGERLG
jgi:multiple sugar transport system ATP-binding protein